MRIQAALNGARTHADHGAVPLSADDLARDAAACVAAGAESIHLHPRQDDGAETLGPTIVDAVVRQVRSACGVPVGVTTGAWIEPDVERRVQQVRAWREPDFASVNLDEDGAEEIMRALLAAGVGIEAGISTAADVERLAASGFGERLTRILVEPFGDGADDAESVLALIEEIHAALDRFGLAASRLQHSDDIATWPVLEDAIRRGLDTRVGFEDTLLLPDGEVASGNAALIRAAVELGAAQRKPDGQS